MKVAIQSTGLTRRFGKVRVVDGVDLSVRAGTITGFLAPDPATAAPGTVGTSVYLQGTFTDPVTGAGQHIFYKVGNVD